MLNADHSQQKSVVVFANQIQREPHVSIILPKIVWFDADTFGILEEIAAERYDREVITRAKDAAVKERTEHLKCFTCQWQMACYCPWGCRPARGRPRMSGLSCSQNVAQLRDLWATLIHIEKICSSAWKRTGTRSALRYLAQRRLTCTQTPFMASLVPARTMVASFCISTCLVRRNKGPPT